MNDSIASSSHLEYPESAYMQNSSDSINKLKSPTRQVSTNSLSTIGLGIHTFHPRLQSSIVWIDDEYKELDKLKEVQQGEIKKRQKFSLKAVCNLLTLLLVIGLILFLFIYPLTNK